MKARQVVAFKAMPWSMFGWAWRAAVLWLFMDRYHAPGWAYGVFWTVWAIMGLTAGILAWTQEEWMPQFADKVPE